VSQEVIFAALDALAIEIPSWGFANTGTRFGKFTQAGAAATLAEKIADAGAVHGLTGCCPTLATHTLWDFPEGVGSVPEALRLAAAAGIRLGAVNPNVFQDQAYKFGSLANPDAAVREKALAHVEDSIAIAQAAGVRDISLWFTDGSNYPGTQNLRRRKRWFKEGLRAAHSKLGAGQRLLVEYKPFEPAFYHTDIADWGMAMALAREAGPRAKVLVDTGHHYPSQNIEQIVAWLLDEGMLGGFHFNDRRYADDDLTLGSIDPYQAFRIFAEIFYFEWERGEREDVGFTIDQSHNLKPKIEETIQTAANAQELWAKAASIDFAKLARCQERCELIDAEECYKRAFFADVRPAILEWRRAKGLPADPLAAYRESGYQARIDAERGERNAASGGSYA